MPKILIDTNIFVAYAVQNDKYHQQATVVLESLISEACIVTAPALAEIFTLVSARSYHMNAVLADQIIRSTCRVEALTEADMNRMSALLSKYANLEIDYVDASIIAVAERLDITRIATFDRRDFSVIVPSHVAHFELLP